MTSCTELMQMILPAAQETSLRTPRRLNSRDRLAGAQELAGQVDADHRVPLLERHLLEGRVLLQAGVGDQDVDRAERLEHPGEHRLDLILLATSACSAMALLPLSLIASTTSSASSSPER